MGRRPVKSLDREQVVGRETAHQRPCVGPRVEHRSQSGAVEIVGADALKPITLPAALEGIDTAYYLVHSMAAGRDFGRLDLQAAENFAAAAQEAGVRRIVYLGGLGHEGVVGCKVAVFFKQRSRLGGWSQLR